MKCEMKSLIIPIHRVIELDMAFERTLTNMRPLRLSHQCSIKTSAVINCVLFSIVNPAWHIESLCLIPDIAEEYVLAEACSVDQNILGKSVSDTSDLGTGIGIDAYTGVRN